VAARELLDGLPRHQRPVVRLLLVGIAKQVRHLEVGKASFVMAIDGARAAVRRIGDELVTAGLAGDRDDAFYLTYDELVGLLPGNFAELVAYRRACRVRHTGSSLPMTWTGMPTPTAEDTAADGSEPSDDVVVTGAAAGGGVVEGTAAWSLTPTWTCSSRTRYWCAGSPTRAGRHCSGSRPPW
jgi:pyruvate,water dikinase